jgi:4-amino-4-deoxy-L-arabinose transferase-like glycosyltransferase
VTAPAPPSPASRPARAVGWIALAGIGQAAALSMIDAGPRLHYQHYPAALDLFSQHQVAAAVVGLQVALVVWATVRWGWAAARAIVPLPPGRLVAAVVVASLGAATVSPDPRTYAAELVLAAAIQLVNLANVVLAALALPAGAFPWLAARLRSCFRDESPGEPRLGRDWFGWRAGLLASAVAATLAVTAYERHPHVPDEVVYVMQANYLASGRLTMPPPPVVEAFDVDLLSYEPDRWFSPVPPGWPAVLAVGAWIGLVWLVNPVLAGLAVVLAYAWLKELYGRRLARIATTLLATSPWLLFLGMSFMTHMLTLVCVLVAVLGVARARRTGSIGWSLAAGIGVGATSLIRPLDGLIVGVVIAAWALGVGGRRLSVPALAALFVGTMGTGALAFPYNQHFTGHPLRFPINVYTDRLYGPNSNAYGFGPDRGLGWAIDPNPGHSPLDGVINANLNAFGINTDLLGWSAGSLWLLAVMVASRRWRREDWQMLGLIGAFVIAYFPYYFSGGPDYGARYWFPIVVPLVALSARGFEVFERAAGRYAAVITAVFIALAAMIFVPWRAIDKYHEFRGMKGGLGQLAARQGVGADLVLVRGERFPDYASAAIENAPDLGPGTTVYAWDRSAEVRARVLTAFPERRVWLVDGPSVTGGGYRFVAGPLEPGTVPPFGAVRP